MWVGVSRAPYRLSPFGEAGKNPFNSLIALYVVIRFPRVAWSPSSPVKSPPTP